MTQVNLAKEAAKIGIVVAVAAILAKWMKKVEDSWFGLLFFRR